MNTNREGKCMFNSPLCNRWAIKDSVYCQRHYNMIAAQVRRLEQRRRISELLEQYRKEGHLE